MVIFRKHGDIHLIWDWQVSILRYGNSISICIYSFEELFLLNKVFINVYTPSIRHFSLPDTYCCFLLGEQITAPICQVFLFSWCFIWVLFYFIFFLCICYLEDCIKILTNCLCTLSTLSKRKLLLVLMIEFTRSTENKCVNTPWLSWV